MQSACGDGAHEQSLAIPGNSLGRCPRHPRCVSQILDRGTQSAASGAARFLSHNALAVAPVCIACPRRYAGTWSWWPSGCPRQLLQNVIRKAPGAR